MTRILIIDDEKSIRIAFTEHLLDKGYEVESVEDGEKAVSLAKERDFDVIVLDIILPGLSGLDLLESIKRASPLSKIVMITGQPSVETITAALRAGAIDYLSKPVKPEDLTLVVGNAARIRALEVDNKKYRERLENLVLDRTRQVCEFNERLQHIAEETKNFSVCDDPQDLAQRILDLLSKNMSASGGSLFWREEDHLRLVAAIDSGHQKELIPLPPPSGSVIGKVFEAQEGFVVSDIEVGEKIESSGWSGYNNGSLMALPYQNAKGEILGVLTLHNKEQPPFTQQDLKIGRIISAHSLEALKNIQLKRSLAESVAKYRKISEGSLTGIFIHCDGRIVYANPRMGAMLGYRPEELPQILGRPFINYIHVHDRELVGARARRRLENEHPLDHYEIRLLQKGGQTIWVEILVSLIEHEGRPAVTGNVIDITPRKKAEEEIAERNRELTILNRFISASNEAVTLTELLKIVLDGVLDWLGLDGGGIYLLENGDNIATLKIHANLPKEFVEQVERLPVDKPPYSSIFSRGKPLYVENYPAKFPNRADFSEILSLASVPIFSGDRVIGALNVASRKMYTFPDSVKSMLTMIGKEIGNSISRLLTEEALRQSEVRLREITDNMSDMVSKTDLQGVLDYVSPSHKSVLGLAPEDLVGTVALDRVHPDDMGEVSVLMGKILSEKKPQRVEHRLQCADGTYKWIESIGEAILDNHGLARGIIISSRDISERRQYEEALKESEDKFRVITEQSLIGVGILQDDIIKYANKACGDIVGYDVDEILAWSPGEYVKFLYPEDTHFILEQLEKKQRGDADVITNYETRFIAKNDREKWVNVFSKTIIYQGKTADLVTFADITDRKKAEEEKDKLESQLQQSQKMEAVGRLAGGIAHDFNNILTGISGYAEMILDSIASVDPLYSDVFEIKKAAGRASNLTQQLLGFSRKQVIAPIVVNLNDLIDNSQKMLARIIEEDVELEFVPGDNLNNVKVDPHQLDQILVNLAVNARDAMPDGGKLVIETKNVILDADYCSRYPWVVPGNYVMLAVSDTGLGMPVEIHKHIFEPFYTTKDKGKGTGLGLSTVYGIVKQNNGFINVYSEEGIGSTFKIYMPRIKSSIEIESKPIEELSLTGSETVLVVEDEEMVRNLATKVLTIHGYSVMEIERGIDAVEACRTHKGEIHLLLADVIMPGMTGKEVYDKVKLFKPDMKVLYMSGYTENVIAHHGVLHDGTNFIQKPFSVEELAKKVREILDE